MQHAKKPKTFIRMNPSLHLRRSPVDGMWRAWARIHTLDGYHEEPVPGETLKAPPVWVTVASERKAREAIEAASKFVEVR